MRNKHYSRKRRQLKYLVKKLNNLLPKADENLKSEIKKMAAKIKYLVSQLSGIVSANRMKRILGVVALFIGVSFTNTVSAQYFVSPVQNPFGFTPTNSYFSVPALADLDADGDLDVLTNTVVGTQYSYGHTFAYEQNIGSSVNTQFSLPLVEPFGLSAPTLDTLTVIQFHNLIDMDGDGDFDILAHTVQSNYYSMTTEFRYYENTGSDTNPMFSNPITSPFGLVDRPAINIGDLIDIDNDGDFDMISAELSYGSYSSNLVFFENIGSPSNPQFSTPQINPFGLNTVTAYGVHSPALTDIDGDGDLDLLSSTPEIGFLYYENTGSISNPQFSLPALNPFGLSADTTNDEGVTIVEFGDMDSDGDMDIILGGYYGSISYYENTSINSSIKEIEDIELNIYPNPVNNTLNVSSDKKINKIEIYDALGRVIYAESNPSSTINVEQLEAGLYSIAIIFNDKRIVKKFTK